MNVSKPVSTSTSSKLVRKQFSSTESSASKRNNDISQKRGIEKMEKIDLKFVPEIVKRTHLELIGLKIKLRSQQ